MVVALPPLRTTSRWHGPLANSLTNSLTTAFLAAICLVLLLPGAGVAHAADPFRETVRPFVAKYCVECHGETTAEAQLNLHKYQSAEAIGDDFRQWEHVITFVERDEMPPESADAQPTDEERREFLKALRALLDVESRKLAGDPGIVLPRRLNNSEYDHAIRDLTGVDIRPTRSFPVDPAAGEGFDNTGEALAMTPSLVAKQLAAAQYVADHALLTTRGIEFAPHPVATFADRAKFYEQSILRFYQSHQVDYTTYLTACWEYRQGLVLGNPGSISDFAHSRKLSPSYLSSLYALLEGDPAADPFYVGWLRRNWRAIPKPEDPSDPKIRGESRAAVEQLARAIESLSRQLCPRETEAIVSNAGNGPIQHLERRRKTAAERDSLDVKLLEPKRRLHASYQGLDRKPTLRVALSVVSGMTEKKTGKTKPEESAQRGFVVFRSPTFSKATPDNYRPDDKQRNTALLPLLREHAPAQLDKLRLGKHPRNSPLDAEAFVLAVGESVEIEIPVKALEGARDIRLFVDAELETGGDNSAAIAGVYLREADSAGGQTGGESAKESRKLAAPPTFLVATNSDAARSVERSGVEFCRHFPNRFYFVDDTRGLSAGFHLIEGFFRDDQPLYKHVLDDGQRAEIDRLWTELEFVTGITEKMLRGFVFFERSERNFLKHADFDPFKEEDPKLVEPEMLTRFERVYLDRSGVKQPVDQLATHPIHIFFEQIREGLARRVAGQRAAEPLYVTNLESLARMAYRRPLTEREKNDLRTFFRDIAAKPDQGVEEAVRMSIVRVLMSPYFTVRFDPAPAGDAVQPLADLALASRLSFFLWSTTPDSELLDLAEAGKLRDEQTLREQVRRMLRDPRATDFAREFFGQWLGYRDFPRQESVDRAVFKDFDEPLKEAMFEEPTRWAAHLIREDLPVTLLLETDETFVNARLARHYGLPFDGAAGEWVKVSGLEESGRGGLLGMAVFLTKNSQPQRTSPVKRGFWVVHKVLGEHIPAPPADVVALPAKETDTNGKTIRQLLAAHVEDVKCARCHVRFDAVGLAMEGFDAIGRRRSKDLAGRPVDNVVELPTGEKVHGVPEFARYLARERREEYLHTLCRKLVGYALGRSLQLSDQPLLDELRIALDKHEDRFVPLIETVVMSPQFRNQRCRDFSTAKFRSLNQGVDR